MHFPISKVSKSWSMPLARSTYSDGRTARAATVRSTTSGTGFSCDSSMSSSARGNVEVREDRFTTIFAGENMNNDVTETTTDSPSKQGSVKRRPKLYTRDCCSDLDRRSSRYRGGKTFARCTSSRCCAQGSDRTASVNRCRKISTDGFSSLGSSRPWIK